MLILKIFRLLYEIYNSDIITIIIEELLNDEGKFK